jgi:hypothetical protein
MGEGDKGSFGSFVLTVAVSDEVPFRKGFESKAFLPGLRVFPLRRKYSTILQLTGNSRVCDRFLRIRL